MATKIAILKKNSLWLLPFYIAVATYCYYEKVCRTMRTAIVSYLLKRKILKAFFMKSIYIILNNQLNRDILTLFKNDVS